MTEVDIARLFVLVVVAAAEIFWLRMLGDLLKNEFLAPQERRQWLFMFIFLNIIAAALYYVNEYRRRHN